jgi:hypothetical protein
VPTTGDDKPCAFCRSGSRGKEHLTIFCQPLRRAWIHLGGTGHWLFGLATYDHRITVSAAARFSATIAILAQTFASGEPPSAETAYKLIIQGAHTTLLQALQRSHNGIELLSDTRNLTTHPHWRLPHRHGSSNGLDCTDCPAGQDHGVFTSLAPRCQRAVICADKPCLALRTTSALTTSHAILTLTASQLPSAWPVSQDSPLGLPLSSLPQHCNAEWRLSVCPKCGNHIPTLHATRDGLKGGTLLRALPPPGVLAACIAHHAYQMSFDGAY